LAKKPTLSLHCVRRNGRREKTELRHRTLSEARELAHRVLDVGNGLYTQVDICTEDGTIETIGNSTARNQSEVLLVEDNAGDALLIGQALAESPTSIHLHIARDGEQALHILENRDFVPDLIILDLNIPRISGYGVLASHALKKTPVVVFSASENEADVDRVLSLGAKEFVHKPLDLDDYKSAVTGMIQKWVGP
jgi:chemotaxis family two-component system response regulator Rcp1